MSTKTADPLAEFKRLSKPGRMKCGVLHVLKELKSDKDRELLRAAFAASPLDIRHSAISAWLEQPGRNIKCAPDVISRHRRHKCSCETEDR